MADLSIISAPNVIVLDRNGASALADALATAIDRALCGLTVDPPAGQPAEDYAAACARVEQAFAPCRAAYRDQPWALAEIEALVARLREGLANARAGGRLALTAEEDCP